MKKYIFYIMPFTLVFLSPWVYRLSIENIMLAVPHATFENASNTAWIIAVIVAFLTLMAAALSDGKR